ncbi:MAG: hypothetical protein FWG60_03515 [Methanomassiliicoccaceae archaeon]|nr:hypothetical protein [Methanomassiliicoccaceae archaeon]
MFAPIETALPKYCCEFFSRRGGYPYFSGRNDPEWDEPAIRALTRMTAFIRKCVKEMGEFWYVKQWTET